MAITISVLITYHNEGALLTECLDSLRNSAHLPDEILVYDDASSIPPEPYLPPGLIVRVVKGSENRGPVHGRNVLLKESSSEYVHFHDADDLFHPEWCLRVVERLSSSGVDVVFTEIRSTTLDGVIISDSVLDLAQLARGEDLVRFCLRGVMLPPAGSYRRVCLERIGGYRPEMWQAEDFDFHVRLAMTDITFSVITDALVTYRARPSSRSADRVQCFTYLLSSLKYLSERLASDYKPDVMERAANVGCWFTRNGAQEEAREAFSFAFSLGRPSFKGERPAIRFLARSIGPERALRLACQYRSALPHAVRQWIAVRGI